MKLTILRLREEMSKDFSKLQRPRHSMPSFVKKALNEQGSMNDFQQRPAYQQNDYIGWIVEAKRQETQEKRLKQMLEELEKGGVYMKMKHPISEKDKQS